MSPYSKLYGQEVETTRLDLQSSGRSAVVEKPEMERSLTLLKKLEVFSDSKVNKF